MTWEWEEEEQRWWVATTAENKYAGMEQNEWNKIVALHSAIFILITHIEVHTVDPA